MLINNFLIEQDEPAHFTGPSHVVQLRYVSSPASTGGWRVLFQIALTRGT